MTVKQFKKLFETMKVDREYSQNVEIGVCIRKDKVIYVSGEKIKVYYDGKQVWIEGEIE